jgi:hypothetical protein
LATQLLAFVGGYKKKSNQSQQQLRQHLLDMQIKKQLDSHRKELTHAGFSKILPHTLRNLLV